MTPLAALLSEVRALLAQVERAAIKWGGWTDHACDECAPGADHGAAGDHWRCPRHALPRLLALAEGEPGAAAVAEMVPCSECGERREYCSCTLPARVDGLVLDWLSECVGDSAVIGPEDCDALTERIVAFTMREARQRAGSRRHGDEVRTLPADTDSGGGAAVHHTPPPALPGTPRDFCRVYWGSHGCDRPRGHEGPHLCLTCRESDEDGWVGAPPYYGPETNFYGEDCPAIPDPGDAPGNAPARAKR